MRPASSRIRAMILIGSHIENKAAGVRLQGHSGQKTSFTGTAINGELAGSRYGFWIIKLT